MQMIATLKEDHWNHDDDEYGHFLTAIQRKFDETINQFGKALFTTSAINEDLFKIFLSEIPEYAKQHYTCHACRRFVNTFGGIVSITENRETIPIMWPESAPVFFQNAVSRITALVKNSKVTGVFLNSNSVWGQPVTGEWNHMAVQAPSVAYKGRILTAYQSMAEKKQDYLTLLNGLTEFPVEAVDQAIVLLETDSLYRSEKCLGVAKWLKKIHLDRAQHKNSRQKNNITWLAVATAPPGFCHIKSTMIGTLLEDIVSGMSFESVKRRFDEKMHPLQYQRPQVAPSAGNIAQAEKIMEKLQAEGALARRFATLDDIDAIWTPNFEQDVKKTHDKKGIFGHLKPKGDRPKVGDMSIPQVTMTWDKFFRTVLPEATKIELFNSPQTNSYSALVTAVNEDAPPIIQWDLEESRNPVSWYLYHGGSRPESWNLKSGSYSLVSAICLSPNMWKSDKFEHQGKGVMFILDGAKDTQSKGRSGLGLFPEIMKSEFHSIRSTIEAFSRAGEIEGQEESSACGLLLQQSSGDWNSRIKVTSLMGVVEYCLDRWIDAKKL